MFQNKNSEYCLFQRIQSSSDIYMSHCLVLSNNRLASSMQIHSILSSELLSSSSVYANIPSANSLTFGDIRDRGLPCIDRISSCLSNKTTRFRKTFQSIPRKIQENQRGGEKGAKFGTKLVKSHYRLNLVSSNGRERCLETGREKSRACCE